MSNHSVDLSQLKDIHLPIQPSWWPPAYGWWLLLLILLSAGLTIVFLIKRAKRSTRYKQANQALADISHTYQKNTNQQELINQLSGWLKQVALLAFPEHQLAPLHGQPWLAFLDKTGHTNEFSHGHGQIFGDAMYCGELNINAHKLLGVCEQWLSQVKPQLIIQGKQYV